MHLDFESTERVSTVGHAGGTNSISDEYGTLDTFCADKKVNDRRCDMNAVRDDVGSETVVGQNGAEKSGLAVVESTHGIEGVRGVASPRLNAFKGSWKVGIRMTEAHADVAIGSCRDQIECTVDFGSDGKQIYMATRSVPHAIEKIERCWL